MYKYDQRINNASRAVTRIWESKQPNGPHRFLC